MSNRFTISEDGLTVHDQTTNLTWQRAVPDQIMTWAEANAYAAALDCNGGGWRLPAVTELIGLVDYGRRNPAIDPEAFPDTPLDWFWTDTPAAGDAGAAWSVGFYGGGVGLVVVGNQDRVRCCR